MEVTVLFFAAHRERVGTADVVVSLPDRATVGTLLSELRARGGGWADLPSAPAVAVNRSYANVDSELSDGDEVALIPPVAGG
ncbi:MAG: molybdopterin converting factor subunit 1 [Gemmatimonadetes bacterium]|nr:molybdopterin converting factor subunit 1 [Gemmatimonadota bacterium]MYA63453.1 molybdopterin converting factor subunit 1 [Gemmatimonadota bacterium]MYB99202.1 molybdopterin converting factor subunit 1 [Gemmatimonadota bacterium]MYH52751.1 molybdopterin converting factor subunit 1 [Gemmatimonadota bacterium]MYI47349.1 molybdopterin converting factor subunit 1 [Gemmatimonadota bacterium]